MDRWDMLLAGFAGYVSVVSLARLMAVRRNQLVKQISDHLEQERARREAEAAAAEAAGEEAA